MRNGHYTAGDIANITIDKKQERAVAELKDGNVIEYHDLITGAGAWHSGFQVHEKGSLPATYRKAAVPEKYAKVADIVRKKYNPRGGKRFGAGRPALTDHAGKKRGHKSFYCTDAEAKAMREFLKLLRAGDEAAKYIESLSV